ncbi:uncharacterized protein ACLA_028790 [Aspergillus clavatus NRRL 1]|uniref:Uncharacterized protein n=1 Tax=Aspergillus clavatus (strain ATCC 1007 / CBS 513.65 / DSM 816 / NCTC 3887 / NRRL 1 / QM 1276 / 107) TaxID=344612 RepID=A1CR83_ASPCL|nr:uncharacterized protein ACLA_028790 [Aspergillus clavatus NRRL 1]EAW08154.1 conserved hypothetical protein [Aspergillus clavatus NRRL 1]
MATSISSSSPRYSRFQQAVESLYGNFSSIADPASWTPPPNSGGHRGRYLWTDAFGVLTLLTMHREYEKSLRDAAQAPDDRYLVLARRVVETVHEVLGRTRDGRARLPGATDANPLGGGLRIGKMDERGPDGDGQYHHYLTLWMFALNRLAVATGEPRYNRLGVALARAIHPRFFVQRESARPRMVWKMAMDLSAPLVASEGNLDPVDGYVVFRLLQGAAMQSGDGAVLAEEIADYKRVMERKGKHFVSSDPLDLGMTLWTAHWFSEKEDWAAQLAGRCFEQICPPTFILVTPEYDLFEINRYLERNIKYRLAFREFGTCMGIECQAAQTTEKERAVDLKVYADAITAAWDPYMELSISTDVTPDDLRPITRIMYAAALIPGAFRSGYPEPPCPEK